MDLLQFRFFRVTGRITGGLLLGATALSAIWVIHNAAFGGWFEPEVDSLVLFEFCPRKKVPHVEFWLLVFPILSVMAVAGIKMLRLRKPETTADDQP